jgi:hypothetical protein
LLLERCFLVRLLLGVSTLPCGFGGLLTAVGGLGLLLFSPSPALRLLLVLDVPRSNLVRALRRGVRIILRRDPFRLELRWR